MCKDTTGVDAPGTKPRTSRGHAMRSLSAKDENKASPQRPAEAESRAGTETSRGAGPPKEQNAREGQAVLG